MIDMNEIIGNNNLLFITLDALRFDAAQLAWEKGKLPTLAPYLPCGWERRHTPSSFTYPAHHAFFSGFLPTPVSPGPHPRLFASDFSGSTSIGEGTFVFPQATLPEALRAQGYRTVCIGGTGFFRNDSSLSKVLPGLFETAHWSQDMGVSSRSSEQHQIACALREVALTDPRPLFMFINIAAIHQPNYFYHSSVPPDSLVSHRKALSAVDSALAPLFIALKEQRPTYAIICSDHGTAYGEQGYEGHRVGHEVIWDVPYLETFL